MNRLDELKELKEQRKLTFEEEVELLHEEIDDPYFEYYSEGHYAQENLSKIMTIIKKILGIEYKD